MATPPLSGRRDIHLAQVGAERGVEIVREADSPAAACRGRQEAPFRGPTSRRRASPSRRAAPKSTTQPIAQNIELAPAAENEASGSAEARRPDETGAAPRGPRG
jgi:hypothetical protein